MTHLRENARNVAAQVPGLEHNDDEKRRIARVIWTYSGQTQPAFEQDVGFKRDRLRSMLGKGPHSAPSIDELLVMADAAGVPRGIATDGWAAAEPLAHLQDQISDLRDDLKKLGATVAQQSRELRELRGQDHRKQPPADGRR